MGKKLDKYERERLANVARAEKLNATADALCKKLNELCDQLRPGSPQTKGIRVEPSARALVESAHYSLRRVLSGGYIRHR